jgi:hypothetical protein
LLKTGQFEPMSSRLETAEELRARINWVMSQAEQIEEEIRQIQNSEAYFTVQSIGDNWVEYLKDVVDNFKNQINDLKKWHLFHSNNN